MPKAKSSEAPTGLQSMRNQPGTLREYETIFIVSPDSTNETLTELNTKVGDIITDNEGKLLQIENWGKRKLAYDIKKYSRGVYLYWKYLAKPELITELERNLKLQDSVIRYMSIIIDEDVDPNARPSDVSPETVLAASNTPADENEYHGASVDDSALPTDDEVGADSASVSETSAEAAPVATTDTSNTSTTEATETRASEAVTPE